MFVGVAFFFFKQKRLYSREVKKKGGGRSEMFSLVLEEVGRRDGKGFIGL